MPQFDILTALWSALFVQVLFFAVIWNIRPVNKIARSAWRSWSLGLLLGITGSLLILSNNRSLSRYMIVMSGLFNALTFSLFWHGIQQLRKKDWSRWLPFAWIPVFLLIALLTDSSKQQSHLMMVSVGIFVIGGVMYEIWYQKLVFRNVLGFFGLFIVLSVWGVLITRWIGLFFGIGITSIDPEYGLPNRTGWFLLLTTLVIPTLCIGMIQLLQRLHLSDRDALVKEKNLLLDIMVHDLKNPLQGVLGFSDILKEDSPDNECINYIQTSSRAMLHTLDQVSALAHASLKDSIETVPVDIVSLLQSEINILKPKAEKEGLELIADFGDSLLVKANPICSEIFRNFIDNAIKYAADGRRIIIRAKPEIGKVRIEVEDYGTPLSEEEADLVFERQSRLKKDDRQQGKGLGLSITKQLAESMNGEIGILPRKDGNTFYVLLHAG